MNTLQQATVRPHVISPDSGESILLESAVAELLARDECRVVQILGGVGSGKSTALAHLTATVLSGWQTLLLDDATAADVAAQTAVHRVLCTSRAPLNVADVILPLAAWTDDDLMEYLLAACPSRCPSVMSRLRDAADKPLLEGNPSLCRLVLDEMAADEAVTNVRSALDRVLRRALPGLFDRLLAEKHCLALLLGDERETIRSLSELGHQHEDFERQRPLRHGFVQRILAGDRMVRQIAGAQLCVALAKLLPPALIDELAERVRADENLRYRLQELFEHGEERFQGMAGSILFAALTIWRPPSGRALFLDHGRFRRAQWAHFALSSTANRRSSLTDADLSHADLCEAQLDGAIANRVRLSGANLSRASLVGLAAPLSDLSGADLTSAEANKVNLHGADLRRARLDGASLISTDLSDSDLRDASFCRANLAHAVFRGSQVAGADFSGAHLVGASLEGLPLREASVAGARFSEAILSWCDLEGVAMVEAAFNDAKLDGALLTGSVMPRADFRKANLRGAGLADIQWEGADLRGADLRGCSFHMGSSRSGLVGSPYAGHGSKTGFYTDDYFDQSHKRPEDIRKANLCGADLRGARLTGVDFYLVDLRGALFDADVADHLRRCGAILVDRCP